MSSGRIKDWFSDHESCGCCSGCLGLLLVPYFLFGFPGTELGAQTFLTLSPLACGVGAAALGYSVIWTVRALYCASAKVLWQLLRISLAAGAVCLYFRYISGPLMVAGAIRRGDQDVFSQLSQEIKRSGERTSCSFVLDNPNYPLVMVGLPDIGLGQAVIKNENSAALLMCCRLPYWPGQLGLFEHFPAWKPWLTAVMCWEHVDGNRGYGEICSGLRQWVDSHPVSQLNILGRDIATNNATFYLIPPGRSVTYNLGSSSECTSQPLIIFWYDTAHEFKEPEQSIQVDIRVKSRQTLLWQYMWNQGRWVAGVLGLVIVGVELWSLGITWFKTKRHSSSVAIRSVPKLHSAPALATTRRSAMTTQYPVQSRALEVSQRALAELNQIGNRMVEMVRAGEEAGPIQEYVQSKRRQFSLKLRTEELARIEGMLDQWNKTLSSATQLARTAAGHQVAAEAIQLEVETGLARLRTEYQKQQAELQASSQQARLQAEKALAELRTAKREAEQREQAVEKLGELREQLERERLELELAKVRAERGRLPQPAASAQALDTPEQAAEALRRMVAAQMCTLAEAHAKADQIIEEMRERRSQPPEQLEEERQYLHEMVRRLFRKAEG